MAITQAIQRIGRSNHEAERALALAGCRFDCFIPVEPRFHLGLKSKSNQLTIGGACGLTSLLLQLITQLHRIHQIAVVG